MREKQKKKTLAGRKASRQQRTGHDGKGRRGGGKSAELGSSIVLDPIWEGGGKKVAEAKRNQLKKREVVESGEPGAEKAVRRSYKETKKTTKKGKGRRTLTVKS